MVGSRVLLTFKRAVPLTFDIAVPLLMAVAVTPAKMVAKGPKATVKSVWIFMFELWSVYF